VLVPADAPTFVEADEETVAVVVADDAVPDASAADPAAAAAPESDAATAADAPRGTPAFDVVCDPVPPPPPPPQAASITLSAVVTIARRGVHNTAVARAAAMARLIDLIRMTKWAVWYRVH
jgi:hypothetical protein